MIFGIIGKNNGGSMRNNKWVFFQVPSKPALNLEEVRYWKNNLSKILKVGLEFEFNLPNRQGSCKGTSTHCPCIYKTDENNCWKKCVRETLCKKEFGDKFKDICAGQMCTGYIMNCAVCEDFTLDCEICEFRYNPDKDPDNIRKQLRDSFKPSQNYGRINASGVHNIVCDGSLLGEGSEGKGAEVITTGRRIDYWEFFKMITKIMKDSTDKGAYFNERCSIHVHLLASYYGTKGLGRSSLMSELEKPLPEIVIANFHQLCRKYQNAITWMSAGLDDYEHFTRWEKFRQSVLDVSPVSNSMPALINIMEERTGKLRGKYGWVNYMFCRFNDNNDLTKFHLEMRSLDGIMSPSAVTAMACLFYAMIIKAVEISRYGLLEVGDETWMKRSMQVKKRLLNGNGGYDSNRLSCTADLTDEDFDFLKREAYELNNQLKHILLKLGPVYEVIEKLAYSPAAIRRCAGKTWDEIEEELAVYIPKETKLEKLLASHIDMRTYVKCKDEKEWCINIIKDISEEEKEDVSEALNAIITAYKSDGEYIWSDNLGTMLKV